MELGLIVLIFVFLLIVYVMLIRPYLLGKREFKCRRCGQCCKLRVNLSHKDIRRLNKAGKTGFTTCFQNLKRKNGYCQFLRFKNGRAFCSVYKSRPDICRCWPVSKGIFGRKIDNRCNSNAGKLY